MRRRNRGGFISGAAAAPSSPTPPSHPATIFRENADKSDDNQNGCLRTHPSRVERGVRVEEALFRRRKRAARCDVREERNLGIPGRNNGELAASNSKHFPPPSHTLLRMYLFLYRVSLPFQRKNQIKMCNGARVMMMIMTTSKPDIPCLFLALLVLRVIPYLLGLIFYGARCSRNDDR